MENFLGDVGRWGQDVGRTMWRPADSADWVQERHNNGVMEIAINCVRYKRSVSNYLRDIDFRLELRLFSKAGNDYVLWGIDVQKRGYTILNWEFWFFVYEFVSQDGRMRENSAKQEKIEKLIYIKLEHPAFGHIPAFQME